ncbi:MAG: DUF2752 domain-containing protein [Muribaculaceae bacterium]|nr:DUF2752 domain-containing protein [Muribaculaceae bacterium]
MTFVRARMRTVVVIIAVIVAGTMYYIADPMKTPFMPRCFFHSLTGLQCPGCGSQRLLHALLHGDLGAAWHANALLLLMIPYLLLLTVVELWPLRLRRLHDILHSPAAIIAVIVLISGWFVLRNFIIPGL